MKRNIVLSIVSLSWIALMLGGCAAPHAKYRTHEHATHAVITPLQVDPNAIHEMKKEQFEEYMRRLKVYNEFVRDTGYASAYQAYAEKQWANDPEGGPPTTPEGWSDDSSYLNSRPGVFNDAKTSAMREEADRLWLRVQEMLKE